MLHEITGDSVDDYFRGTTMIATDDRLAAGHGFQIHEAETFSLTRQRKNFAGRVAGGQLGVGKPAEKVYVRAHAIFFGELFEPVAIIAFADHRKLQFGPARKQARQRVDEGVHAFVAFGGEPAADGENYAARWETGGQ